MSATQSSRIESCRSDSREIFDEVVNTGRAKHKKYFLNRARRSLF